MESDASEGLQPVLDGGGEVGEGNSMAGPLLALCIAITAHSCRVQAGITNLTVMWLKMTCTALRTSTFRLRRLCCRMELSLMSSSCLSQKAFTC